MTGPRFDGRAVLITGAAGGIGAATARRLHGLGARLALADLDTARVEALAATLGRDRCFAIHHDARHAERSAAMVETAVARLGALDVVVTAAGVYREAPVSEMSDALWREAMAVNLDDVFSVCRAAIPALTNDSAIVMLASMAGHRGSANHAAYAGAKGAILAVSRSLARELAPRTRVNAVSPGLIDTPMVQPLMAAQGAALMAQTPMGRLGTPDEVARVVAFLCSDWAAFITGETIHVNGGLHIAG